MSGYNNLCRKMESALHGYLLPEMAGTLQLLKTMDLIGVGNAPDDRIEIVCPRSRPFNEALDASSGATNRYVSCEIRIRTRADIQRDGEQIQIGDARDRHDLHVGRVMDCLYVDGLPSLLNGIAIPQISIEQVDWPVEEIAVDGSAYQTTITFDVLAHSIA